MNNDNTDNDDEHTIGNPNDNAVAPISNAPKGNGIGATGS